jgi:hypothetical protein
LNDLITMRDRGYEGFKIIRQQDHRQAYYDANAARAAIERKPAGWPGLVRAIGLSGRSGRGAGEPVQGQAHYQPLSDWQFASGHTGPFGEEAEGPWRSFTETAPTWLAYDTGLVGPDFPAGKWHDVHCRAPMRTFASQGLTRANRERIPA